MSYASFPRASEGGTLQAENAAFKFRRIKL